ncbi:MAG: hypothetical protein K8S55_07310 [Phycisphaerae bacterium]|nr:hypothetical protein [Phycisphaerae bacterium]
MNRVLVRMVIVVAAVLIFGAGIIVSGEETGTTVSVDQQSPSTLAVNRAEAGGLELAVFSISLGGAMFFLFRPKSRSINK